MQENTRSLINVGLMLAQCRGRWASIKSALVQRLVFSAWRSILLWKGNIHQISLHVRESISLTHTFYRNGRKFPFNIRKAQGNGNITLWFE